MGLDVLRLIVPLVIGYGGASITTYALLDGAATGCAVSTKIANKLNLPIKYENVPAFGHRDPRPKGLTACTVEPLDRSFTLELERVLVNDILTTESDRPPIQSDIERYPFMEGTVGFEELEDDHIGLILSAQYAHTWELGERLSDGPNQPIAVHTAFGWSLIGGSGNESSNEISMNCCAIDRKEISVSVESVDRLFRYDFIARERDNRSPEQEHPSRKDEHATKQFKETIECWTLPMWDTVG